MSVQASNDAFGADRARRYASALARCPNARLPELIPLFLLTADAPLRSAAMVDLGSGTGYLADFYEGLASTVTRVDPSAAMLQASGRKRIVVADMSEASRKLGSNSADLLTCLASFHHHHEPRVASPHQRYFSSQTRDWTPEIHLNTDASLQLQHDTIGEWCEMLRPGGRLVLIDVPGYPDADWNSFWRTSRQGGMDTQAYHAARRPELRAVGLTPDLELLRAFFRGRHEGFLGTALGRRFLDFAGSGASLDQLFRLYDVPEEVLPTSGPMIPTDFFDELVHAYGLTGHYGFFPRNSAIRQALAARGMDDILAVTLPTPWCFSSEQEAVWYVHELFGLGAAWELERLPSEWRRLRRWIADLLGLYTAPDGTVWVFWQLSYFYARKPR